MNNRRIIIMNLDLKTYCKEASYLKRNLKKSKNCNNNKRKKYNQSNKTEKNKDKLITKAMNKNLMIYYPAKQQRKKIMIQLFKTFLNNFIQRLSQLRL